MPAVQTSITSGIRAAVAGMIANTEPNVLISRTNLTATLIGFGKVVQEGATAGVSCTVDLTSMTADTYLGISVRERSARPETPDGFGQYESVRIMRKGVIWVAVGGAVTAGTDVTVTLATGALGSESVATGIVAIPRARWESSTTGAGLAKIRLD